MPHGTNFTEKLLKSWQMGKNGINHFDNVLAWIEQHNQHSQMDMTEISINDGNFWFIDSVRGEILNQKRGFFSITGMQYLVNDHFVQEQPIILQHEIGYLGIIVSEMDGIPHFLMQAKIEPGNVNKVQISPTIQATKSNFTRVHGGRLPYYFSYFENCDTCGRVLYDQLQSEQASRFSGKRNRNILLKVDDEIPLHDNFIWLTLGQIKALLKYDNLVNMNTRTVLSGLPLPFYGTIDAPGHDAPDVLRKNEQVNEVVEAYRILNTYKMYNAVKTNYVSLFELKDWETNEYGIFPKNGADFMVKFYDIAINDREVKQWSQPLVAAIHQYTFVLFSRKKNGLVQFLISITPEIGCFDKVEFGPTMEANNCANNLFVSVYQQYSAQKDNIKCDVVLSEEGGRFYHDQNRYVILEVSDDAIDEKAIADNAIWVTYATLNTLLMPNNCLNIQLRTLISLIELEHVTC